MNIKEKKLLISGIVIAVIFGVCFYLWSGYSVNQTGGDVNSSPEAVTENQSDSDNATASDSIVEENADSEYSNGDDTSVETKQEYQNSSTYGSDYQDGANHSQTDTNQSSRNSTNKSQKDDYELEED